MVIQPPEPSEGAGALRQAILCTIVYGDLFDYPLDVLEIHRYLSHVAAPLEAVAEMLDSDPVLRELIDSTGPWYHLVGRAHLSEVRAERALASRALWDAANSTPLARRIRIIHATRYAEQSIDQVFEATRQEMSELKGEPLIKE